MTGRLEIGIDAADYPPHLRDSQRPPRVLRVMGNVGALIPGVAIIGARRATPYGISCARMFGACAAGHGVTVVSGGAIGCDLAAQTAALDAGGRSIAVLGCGADVDYPRSASKLLARLRDGEGAVVSELPWGAPPLPGQFPARNRIIAGLAAVVLVVEAALPSGTFSTADSALDSGRDVLAVPGSILYPASAGSNRLIRQGAQPVTCEEDFLEALQSCGLLPAEARADGPLCDTCDPSFDPLLAAVSAHPMSADELCATLGLAPAVVLAAMAELETAGRVARYPDGRYGSCRPR